MVYLYIILKIIFKLNIQGFKASARYIVDDNDEADLYMINDNLIPESTESIFDSLLKNENEKIRFLNVKYIFNDIEKP